MTFNSVLADQVLGHILAHPEEHDQANWATKRVNGFFDADCRTTYCFAGWACQIADNIQPEQLRYSTLWSGSGYTAYTAYRMPGGEVRDFESRAIKLLGLGRAQANDLFHGKRSIPQLQQIVKELSNGSWTPPPEWPCDIDVYDGDADDVVS